MKNKTVLIQASSRSDGDTNTVISYLNLYKQFDIIDLKTKNISHYDYNHNNRNDDFLPLIEEIIKSYNTIVFVTPVYWYSMSGILKVFFDRISDLLTIEKELGRQLRGKNMAMISVNNANDLKKGFEMPFVESANYLGMHYLGDIHTWVEDGQLNNEVKKIIDRYRGNLPA